LYVDNDSPVLADTMSAISHDGFYHGVKLACFGQHSKDEFFSLKKKYIQCVLKKIDERFNPQSMDALQCMNSVLNPKLLPQRHADISNYGDKELSTILDFYGVQCNVDGIFTPSLINSDRMKRDFVQFKFLMNSKRHLSLSDFLENLVTSYSDEFPDFCTLAHILLVIPLTSVPCERGFSVQNRLKSKARNRLGVDRVEKKMKISFVFKHCEGVKRKIVENGTNKFTEKAKRRKY
jgi:hypothetical protein